MSLASVIVVVVATAHAAFGKRAEVEGEVKVPSKQPPRGDALPGEPSMPPILAEPR
jgi:hypothetical protein